MKKAAATNGAATGPIHVAIVDDHTFMRELITAQLSRQGGRYKVVAQVGDAATAISVCKALRPDLLILDLNLPDRSGLEIVPQVRAISPGTRILLCSAFLYEQGMSECLACGADGFVEKTNTWEDFLEAVRRVGRGERYFCSRNIASQLSNNGAHNGVDSNDLNLTAREKEVLSLVAEGRTSKEIATLLGVSVLTVDTHRANLMTKAGVRNVAALVLFAVRNGIVDAGKRYKR